MLPPTHDTHVKPMRLPRLPAPTRPHHPRTASSSMTAPTCQDRPVRVARDPPHTEETSSRHAWMGPRRTLSTPRRPWTKTRAIHRQKRRSNGSRVGVATDATFLAVGRGHLEGAPDRKGLDAFTGVVRPGADSRARSEDRAPSRSRACRRGPSLALADSLTARLRRSPSGVATLELSPRSADGSHQPTDFAPPLSGNPKVTPPQRRSGERLGAASHPDG
jgi:hypothetical protein